MDKGDKGIFKTPYDQYHHLNGKRFTVIKQIIDMDDDEFDEFDTEVLPLYLIEFEDTKEQIAAWPEEIELVL